MKRPSLRTRINAFCKSCIYDRYAAGTWREQVRDCTAPACPLFDVRPKLASMTPLRPNPDAGSREQATSLSDIPQDRGAT